MVICLTPEVRAVLERGKCEANAYFLPKANTADGRLDRKLYEAVNKVLTNAGGRWDKKSQSHLFDSPPAKKLGLVMQSGVSRNEKRDKLKLTPEAFHRLHNIRMANDEAGYRMAESKPRFDRLANRHENGTGPRAVVVHQLFQTPPEIARRLADLLDLQRYDRVLEPSAGLGRLLDALKPFEPLITVAVEIAAECCAELYRQERGVTLKQADFLTVHPADVGGLFDAVIMNPPFTMSSDIKHISHALKFIKPGGKLAALCLNAPNRRAALGHLCEQWIDLEPRSFKESGTNIDAAMILIRK